MSTELGTRAEAQAANYLERLDFRILGRNLRTRWSELDIVAEKAGVIHIVEVKYRSNPDYGSGFDYISIDKLRRLSRAAQMLMAKFPCRAYQIDVVSIEGPIEDPAISLIENVTA